jgi:DNA mismatch repair protein MutL
MGPLDARNCFERHATSKISAIEDLFTIKTMGFRGEALASIAAVSQVSMKTKTAEQEIGTAIEIENSVVVEQTPCACGIGTSISMKNLFFNVPARRNFLKSNVVELKHITDEFIHVALAFPDIFFSMTSNGQEVFHLEKGSLKQRIVQLMGNSYTTRLVQVEEKTDYLNVFGFIGKPDTAKKTRGDQYLFVNNRFIRNAYLNHAIVSAYEELIQPGSFPFFVLFIDLDPAHVDVNVHPTKQEIKFDDDKIIYAFIKSAIRHALAQFSIAPALDFELDPSIQQLDAVSKPFTDVKQGEATTGGLYKSFVGSNQAHKIESSSNLKDWRSFFESAPKTAMPEQQFMAGELLQSKVSTPSFMSTLPSQVIQIHASYIVCEHSNGLIVLNQQLAHQQILFEKFNAAWSGKAMAVQQELFPQAITLSPSDAQLLQSILSDLMHLGYQLEPFGNNTFVVQGSPADHPTENNQSVIEMILEDVKDSTSKLHQSYKERISRTLARKHGIRVGTKLSEKEMLELIDLLSICTQPKVHFDGKPIYVEVKNDYLSSVFGI